MAQLDNLLDWCLRKGKEEKHRGLRKTNPDMRLGKRHLEKADHYLRAGLFLRDNGYADIAVAQLFYAMYHCLLALLAKHGYESRNQRCTFAVVEHLIVSGRERLDREWIERIASYENPDDAISLREEFQYGVETKVNPGKLAQLVEDAKEILTAVRTLLA